MVPKFEEEPIELRVIVPDGPLDVSHCRPDIERGRDRHREQDDPGQLAILWQGRCRDESHAAAEHRSINLSNTLPGNIPVPSRHMTNLCQYAGCGTNQRP